MKCNFCEEQLEQIIFTAFSKGDVEPHLDCKNMDKRESIILFACIGRDCKNCGVVMAIPQKSKED